MKKFLIIFIFLCCSVVTHAASVPQWSEFCPIGYENPQIMTDEEIEIKAKLLADEQTKVFYCKSDTAIAKILRGITILPALDCYCGNKIAKSTNRERLYNENEKISYWYMRKKQFENELKTCEGLSTDGRAMCYQKVRELEIQKNNNLEQKSGLQSIQRQLWLNNFSD